MAAFSQQYPTNFLLDSVFFPNTITKIPGFSEYPNTTPNLFSQFYPFDSFQECPIDVNVHESSCLENGSPIQNLEQITPPMTKNMKTIDGSSRTSSTQSNKVTKEVRGKKQKRSSGGGDDEVEKKPSKVAKKDQKKASEEAPEGYIHVRARRGQATDSHSLAERVRREKISERMKMLQAIVPGCDKVTGKALMLDEIINYVQSLQNQVEFLSVKLASVNPMLYDFGADLDTFMVRPQRMSSMASAVPNVQESSPGQGQGQGQGSSYSDATLTFTSSSDNYTLMDNISSSPHIPSHSQDNGQLLWDVDEQRQRLMNQQGFSNNLCVFH